MAHFIKDTKWAGLRIYTKADTAQVTSGGETSRPLSLQNTLRLAPLSVITCPCVALVQYWYRTAPHSYLFQNR